MCPRAPYRINPSSVTHNELPAKIQDARRAFHARMIDYFETKPSFDVKKLWFIAALLDPRWKKLDFEGADLIRAETKRDAVRWLTTEYKKMYEHKVYKPPPAGSSSAPRAAASASASSAKRRKLTAAAFFGTDADDDDETLPENAATATGKAYEDEITAYLNLPKESNKIDPAKWWKEKETNFPNLSVMARQYLGCPASSATVERLFSHVGIAFSKKRKSSQADTLIDEIFTKLVAP